MKNLSLSRKLILATLPLLIFSCGTPNDRDAVLNPKVSGRMITLGNVSDITKATNAASATYFKPGASKEPSSAKNSSATSFSVGSTTGATVPSVEINADVRKILGLVATPDRKAFLDRHLNSGGLVALVVHADNIRIYGVSDRTAIAKIASGPSDLTWTDLKNAKKSKIGKTVETGITRKDEPTDAARFIEIAAIEIEKSGVLESEKSDYNETKPLLNIVTNLPIEVSTHALLKAEIVVPEAKKISDATIGSVTPGPAAAAPAQD